MRRVRSSLFVLCFATLVLASAASPDARAAEAEPALEAARKLFADGLTDEEALRFGDALAKFESVQKVRDTTAVRYRIAKCLEGLGRQSEARASYERVGSASYATADDHEITKAAAEDAARLKSLIKDERATPPATVAAPTSPQVPSTEAPTSDTRNLAYVAFSASAVFGATAVVFAVLRERAIDDITSACPQNHCPRARENEVTAAQDQARRAGPIAIGATILSAIGLGLGTYWLWQGTRGLRGTAALSRDYAGLQLEGTL